MSPVELLAALRKLPGGLNDAEALATIEAAVEEETFALRAELEGVGDLYRQAHAELDRIGAPRSYEIDPPPLMPNSVHDRIIAWEKLTNQSAADLGGKIAELTTVLQRAERVIEAARRLDKSLQIPHWGNSGTESYSQEHDDFRKVLAAYDTPSDAPRGGKP